MALFAIGDVHGCLTALETVWDAAAPHPGDTVVFLGDYVDRGPDTRGVLQWLHEKQQTHRLVMLRGNHDLMMMSARRHMPDLRMWLDVGGLAVLDSYGIGDDLRWHEHVPAEHWRLLEATHPYHREGNVHFVHATLTPGVPLKKQSDEALYWEKLQDPAPYAPDALVVCGHTAQRSGQIADFGHTVCIDTFVYGDGYLTCFEVESGRYWQANQQGEVGGPFVR
ncbi:MAG: metallophosphoesterase family protein [Catalinimonas sp.]